MIFAANQRNSATTKEKLPPLKIVGPFNGTEEEFKQYTIAICSANFKNARSFCEQVGALCSYLRNGTFKVSYRIIGKVFNKDKSSIRDQHMNFLRGEVPDGRPPMLKDSQLGEIYDYIIGLHSNASYPIYPSYKDVDTFIQSNFGIVLIPDTLRHIFREKFHDYFKSCLGKPMEDKRLFSSIVDIEENLSSLSQIIQGIPIEFVFNCDEMGEQTWADAQTQTLIVPVGFPYEYAPYPVSRSGRHASVLVAINPLGMAGEPQFTVPRENLDSEIYQVIHKSAIQVVHTKKGYVTTDSFKYWFENSFLPHLRLLRVKHNYQGPAVLIYKQTIS